MAYLAFDETAPLPATGARVHTRAGFTALEWRVIALAGQDDVASTGRPSRIANLFRRMFGFTRANGLADPRLEALRSVTVLAWARGDRLPDEVVADFLAQGFDRAQLVLLLGEVARRRAAVKPAATALTLRSVIGVLIAIIGLGAAVQAAGTYFDDALLGVLTGVLAFVGIVAIRHAAPAIRPDARLA